MNDAWNYLIVITFIVEVTFLAVMERRIWGNVFTPLNILMLPFAAVLFLSIYIVKLFNLYPFVYESIIVWELGLLIFAIPSWFCSIFLKPEDKVPVEVQMVGMPNPKVVFFSVLPILAVYGLHLKSVLGASTSSLGSDQFAEEATAGGMWSHFFVLIMTLEIFCIFYMSKKNWFFIIPVLVCIVFCVLNQVKGWVLIPLIGASLIKVFTGQLHISLRTVVIVLLGGFGFFFLSYYLSLVLSEDKEFTDDVLFFIFRNFFHYLSSGVLGLSMDWDRGILEEPSVEYLFTPFHNIANLLTGNKLLSNLNGYYLQTTWPGLGTNIRSFMGTIYVYGREFAPFVVLLYASVSYVFYFCMIRKRTSVWVMLSAWFCSLLFMGWFDYYFALLIPFEVMALIALINSISRLLAKRDVEAHSEKN